MDNKQERVNFIGIEGMDYKPMETVILEKRSEGVMALVEHPQGYKDDYLGKYVLFVDIKLHLRSID